MKKLIVALAALSLLTAPVFASVSGSEHDIAGNKQCESCHVPHNATQADKLWAGTAGTGYTAVQNLCWTCHRAGGIAQTVSYDVMNTSLENHVYSTGTSIVDCSGGNSCHDVHTQNPNGTGKFLQVAQTSGSYCRTCHDGTAPNTGTDLNFSAADALGDHTATATNHLPGGFNCEGCHDVHGATPQSTGTATPILKEDNAPSYWGALCLGCHETGGAGYDAVVSADQWGYAQATNSGTETTHPTTATTAGAHTEIIGGCNACHTPHGSAANAYYLHETNANSAYCVSCHSAGGDGPTVGTATHPTPNMAAQNTRGSSATNPMPWADDINEDGVAGADWASATADQMVCETCHSVHGRGTGTESDHFLRNDNSDNQICTFCHAN